MSGRGVVCVLEMVTERKRETRARERGVGWGEGRCFRPARHANSYQDSHAHANRGKVGWGLGRGGGWGWGWKTQGEGE